MGSPKTARYPSKNISAIKQKTFYVISHIAIAFAHILQYIALPILPSEWLILPRGIVYNVHKVYSVQNIYIHRSTSSEV